MNLEIQDFLQAARSNNGIGYVKLQGSGDSAAAVQYGCGFCARKFGWFKRPTAEENRDVRNSFLMALADSPENFGAEAINNAAVALGLKDVLLTASAQPLSKREILKVIDMTRTFDRNQKLGLYRISEGQIDESLRPQFRRVRAGSTLEDARDLVRQLNQQSFSYDDIHRRVVAKLNLPQGHPLNKQREILTTQIHGNVMSILEKMDHLAISAEKNGIMDREVDRLATAKLQAYQLLQDLCDSEKTAEPFSPRMAALLTESCVSGRAVASPEYVRALYENRKAALPLLRAMSAERPEKRLIADAFADFALQMQSLEKSGGLSSEALLDLSQDLLRLAADQQDLNFNAKFIHTSAAGQKCLDELWQDMDFLNSHGKQCPGVVLSGKDHLQEFDLLNMMTGLLCKEVNSDLAETDFEHVSIETRNMVKKLGTEIRDLDPFGKGLVTGDYGRGMREFIIDDLQKSAASALNNDVPDQPLENQLEQMLKDINRGYGLILDDDIVNGTGEFNQMDAPRLSQALQQFFTENGKLDRKALVAFSSFAHQGLSLAVLMNGAQMGLGPFTQATSVDRSRSQFQITRNADQSYSIRFQSEVAGISHFGIFGTPEHVLMDGDGRNSFSCSLTFRMSFAGDQPVFAFEGNPFYEYDFAPRLTEGDCARLNQSRLAEYGSEENVERVFASRLEEAHLEELPPLTAEEKKDISRRSITVMKQLAEDQGLLTESICRGAIRPNLVPYIEARIQTANLQSLKQAEEEGLIQTAVDEKFISHPEFSSLKGAFLNSLRDHLKQLISTEKGRLYSQEEISRLAAEKSQGFLLKKGACLTRLGELATSSALGPKKIFPAMRFWLENQIKTGLAIQNPEYLELLVRNQEVYLPFMEAAENGNFSALQLLNASLDCRAAAENIRELYSGREDIGGGELQHLDGQLRELGRLVFENTANEKLTVSSENLEAIRRTVADLQYVVFNLGGMTPEERQAGPVHGTASAFEDLQQKFICFQQHCEDMLPEKLGPVDDTGDFSQVSDDVRKFLIDQGLTLEDYTGTGHEIEGKIKESFVRIMEHTIRDYYQDIHAKMTNGLEALRDSLADFSRAGQGLTVNGRRITGVEEGAPMEVLTDELVKLCTPNGKDQPDIRLVQAFGSLLHQGLAGSFSELCMNSPYSPFRNSILGSQSTEFSVNGNAENGFDISYRIRIEGDMMMKLTDKGTAFAPVMLSAGSGWDMSCVIHLQQNEEGEVQLSIPEGMDYHMNFIPSDEAEE